MSMTKQILLPILIASLAIAAFAQSKMLPGMPAPLDPTTGKKGQTLPVDDPYNMYYTPDGKYAIVVAEQMMRLMFREPKTMALKNSVWFNCKGIDHMDFSADGTYLIASCEFGNKIIKVDVQSQKQVGVVELGEHTGPQDVKLSPDGKVFYI